MVYNSGTVRCRLSCCLSVPTQVITYHSSVTITSAASTGDSPTFINYLTMSTLIEFARLFLMPCTHNSLLTSIGSVWT